MLRIACVLKSGGYYKPSHVVRLRNNLLNQFDSTPYAMYCLTDLADGVTRAIHEEFHDKRFRVIPLRHNWEGWWSKMELFRLKGAVLYFDLDTLVVGNIDNYADYVKQMNNGSLLCLNGFIDATYGNMMSGMMGWNGDLTYVYNDFRASANAFMRSYRGDQNVIEWIAKAEGIEPFYIQRELKGTYSYKRSSIRKRGLPDDAKIICFHGKPRPEQCREEWVQNIMNKGEV